MCMCVCVQAALVAQSACYRRAVPGAQEEPGGAGGSSSSTRGALSRSSGSSACCSSRGRGRCSCNHHKCDSHVLCCHAGARGAIQVHLVCVVVYARSICWVRRAHTSSCGPKQHPLGARAHTCVPASQPTLCTLGRTCVCVVACRLLPHSGRSLW